MATTARPPPRPREAARLVLTQLPRTLRLVWRAGPGQALSIMLLSGLAGLLPLALAWVGQHIVDGVIAAVAAPDGPARDEVLRWVAIELGLMIASGWVARAHGIARSVLGGKLGFDTNVQILEKSIALELSAFEDPATYDRLQNARREASARPLNLFTKAIDVISQAVTLASIAVVLLSFHPLAMLVLLLASAPMLVAEARFAGQTFALYSWRAPEGRRLNYYEWVLTRDTHAKEVKLYGLGPWFLERYRALYQTFFDAERRLAIRRASWSFVLGAVATVAFYGVYAWVVVATIDGQITLGRMTMLMMVFRQAQGALRSILGAVSGAYEDGLFMSNLFAFLDARPPPSPPRPALPPPAHRVPGFVFEKVSFRYPGRPTDVISELDLTIGPAEKLAIVGENGAGKTTLVKLMTGLYRPTSGRILLDGVPIEELPPEVLHARIGIVLQDFVRYQLSARDNVAFGAIEALGDGARLERAGQQGGASEVIEGLPAKWDTQLGRWFDGGTELSGGQWQKLAVSRAFMRDARVLVLDEPSASLDAEAEHALFQRLRQLTEGRMALLISHRFSTVRMADRIVVLHGGRLVEAGSHEELLALDGRYAHLFRLQAAGYAD